MFSLQQNLMQILFSSTGAIAKIAVRSKSYCSQIVCAHLCNSIIKPIGTVPTKGQLIIPLVAKLLTDWFARITQIPETFR